MTLILKVLLTLILLCAMGITVFTTMSATTWRQSYKDRYMFYAAFCFVCLLVELFVFCCIGIWHMDWLVHA